MTDNTPKNVPDTTTGSILTEKTEVVVESANTDIKDTSVVSPAVTNQPTQWYSEDNKNFIENKGFKSADDVIKSYANLERMVGKSVRIPAEDASAEAKKDFYDKIAEVEGIVIKGNEDAYSKLGRPESADKYDFEDLFPEDFDRDTASDDLAKFIDVSFEMGLNQEQANKLIGMQIEDMKSDQEQNKLSIETGKKKLEEIWGQDYENRLNSAKQTAKIYSEKYPDEMDNLVNGPAGNNPALLNMLAELGQSFKEKGHIGMQQTNFGLTPGEASDKIAEKRADRGFMEAYRDAKNPGHNLALAEMAKLYNIANNS